MKYHIFLSMLVLIMGIIFNLSMIEWVFITFSIFIVLITETVNTCFENLVDLVTDYKYHKLAKKVKDMAAGAVLLAALQACIVGSVIFLPKIWHLIV